MNVKHGFSTLNRLWGKKNKNGNQLSKSTTNLSLSIPTGGGGITTSSSAIDKTATGQSIITSSHLEQNKITPLPVAPSNTPFEQTFRITVLLPRDQLYVARLGAKTKLEKLLELVCENKQLDPEKYEFRHPVDTSQVFSCELTIGAVGLTEIRLCHKSETYDNFNADEIIKLRHNTGRDSLSSSEFSSRNSKHTLKTASPYSSTNSLNSIDSAGMSTNYRGSIAVSSISPQSTTTQSLSTSSTPTIGLQDNNQLNNHQYQRQQIKTNPNNNNNNNNSNNSNQPPIAPVRKKRVAPRPPSQNSIPERDSVSKGENIIVTQTKTNGTKLSQDQQLPRKEFHVSSPNLSQCNNSDMTILRTVEFHKANGSVDCNGNTSTSFNKNNSTNDNTFNSNNNNNNNKIVNNNNNNNNNNNGYTANRNQNTLPQDLDRQQHYHSAHVISTEPNNDIPNGLHKNNKHRPRPASMHIVNHQSNLIRETSYSSNNSINDIGNNRLSYSHDSNDSNFNKIPEPVPRKRIIIAKKKAPAPPPRGLQPPVAYPRTSPTKVVQTQQQEELAVKTEEEGEKGKENLSQNDDVSKEIINNINTLPAKSTEDISPYEEIQIERQKCDEVVQPKVISNEKATSNTENKRECDHQEKEEAQEIYSEIKTIQNNPDISNDLESCKDLSEKHEVVPNQGSNDIYAVPQKLKLQPVKPQSESSSDDDEHIKVYNLKLGKTIVKPIDQEHKNMIIENDNLNVNIINGKVINSDTLIVESELTSGIEPPAWAIAIPAPPNFADPHPTKDNVVISLETKVIVDTDIENQNNSSIINETHRDDTDIDETTNNSGNFITSDIEDGYHGGKNTDVTDNAKMELKFSRQALLQSLDSDQDDDHKRINKNHDNIEIQTDLKESSNQFHSLQSVESNKTDVMSELNNILNCNGGIDTIIKKNDNRNEKIETVEPAYQLNNFKIQPYSNDSNDNAIVEADTIKKLNNDNDIKLIEIVDTNNDIVQTEQIPEPVTSVTDDEKFHKKPPKCTKRSSITLSSNISSQLFRSNNNNIQRSDSFHSTQYINDIDNEDNINKIDESTQRSSSYISLVGAQKSDSKNDLTPNHRLKSLSELSIGESPSLQSLIVMKSILNSRKNSLNNNDNIKNDIVSNDITQNSNGHIESFDNNYYDSINKNNLVDRYTDNTISPSNLTSSSIESTTSLSTTSPSIMNRENQKDNSDSSKENSPKNKIISQNNNNNNNYKSYNTNNDKDTSNTSINVHSYNSNIIDNSKNSENIEKIQKEPEKKWKYQGPPSINLSTWNERPKVQVSIKNDSDYKFGGGNVNNNNNYNNGNNNKNNKVVLTQGYRNSMTIDHHVPSRNSLTNNRNDYHNLQLKQQQQQNINANTNQQENEQQQQQHQQQPKLPFVRSVEYKKSISTIIKQQPPTSTIIDDNDSKILKDQNSTIIQQQQHQQFPKTLSAGNTMTLGRMPKINRTINIVPTNKKTDNVDVVDGFYSNNIEKVYLNGNNDNHHRNSISTNTILQQQQQQQPQQPMINNYWKSTTAINICTNNYNGNSNRHGIERSNSTVTKGSTISIHQQPNERNVYKFQTNSSDKEPAIAPFSQVTLRRTGLKEKILAGNDNETVNITPIIRHSTPIQLQQQHEQNCAKLELKLRTVSTTAPSSSLATSTSTSSSQGIFYSNNDNINATNIQKSAGNSATPIPPPPPPVIRSVVTKQNSVSGVSTTTKTLSGQGPSSILSVTIDPRDQLLNAIRSFNKNSLKHN